MLAYESGDAVPVPGPRTGSSTSARPQSPPGRTFPVGFLEIDRAFIADLVHDAIDRDVVASVTNVAHVLGMTVTAEGIQTAKSRSHIL